MEDPTDRITVVENKLDELITNLLESHSSMVALINDILGPFKESGDPRLISVAGRLEEIRQALCLRPPGCDR
ncbi:MAG: hypothetical protein WKF30_05885 [Pyrinomonadaceae bacterium]